MLVYHDFLKNIKVARKIHKEVTPQTDEVRGEHLRYVSDPIGDNFINVQILFWLGYTIILPVAFPQIHSLMASVVMVFSIPQKISAH